MATLTPTLSLSSTTTGSDAIGMSVSGNLTVTGPSAGISRQSTAENPLGLGAGILIADPVNTGTTFIYVKHLGVLASDGTTACHASNDFVVLTNADGDHDMIKLQPSEFCFFPLMPADGTDNGVEPGGLKAEGGGVGAGGAAHVMIEFGYWTRS